MKTRAQNKIKTVEMIINNRIVTVEFKNIKNMYLRVRPPQGSLHITAPIKTPEAIIRAFVHSKQDWIDYQLDRIKNSGDSHPLEAGGKSFHYRTGDTITLWGKDYPLRVEFSQAKNQVIPEGDRILLSLIKSEEDSSLQERERIMQKWYRQILSQEILNYMKHWEKIIGVEANCFTIRDMKTRWGTCNIREKKICLNLQLVKKHPEGLEYVIVHELVHLLERSHNHVFKAYMTGYLPDWKERKVRLNRR